VDTSLLEKLPSKPYLIWNPFLREEFMMAINKYNNSSAPRPDRISWKYLKLIIKDNKCLEEIINIANTCINLGYWLSHFKTSSSIIISKPNKVAYDSSKSFYLFILLNTLGKLIEKVIGEQLQFHLIANNFIYPNQLERLKQHSTTDAGVVLIHLI